MVSMMQNMASLGEEIGVCPSQHKHGVDKLDPLEAVEGEATIPQEVGGCRTHKFLSYLLCPHRMGNEMGKWEVATGCGCLAIAYCHSMVPRFMLGRGEQTNLMLR